MARNSQTFRKTAATLERADRTASRIECGALGIVPIPGQVVIRVPTDGSRESLDTFAAAIGRITGSHD